MNVLAIPAPQWPSVLQAWISSVEGGAWKRSPWVSVIVSLLVGEGDGWFDGEFGELYGSSFDVSCDGCFDGWFDAFFEISSGESSEGFLDELLTSFTDDFFNPSSFLSICSGNFDVSFEVELMEASVLATFDDLDDVAISFRGALREK